AEITLAIREDGAVIELRHAITVVERSPRDPALIRVARRFRCGRNWRPRVVRAEDAAVRAHEHLFVGRAVVLGMECDDMMVGVRVARIAFLSPPVRSQPPIHAPIIRTEQINASDPHTISVSRVYGDHVVIPTLISEDAGRQPAFAEESATRIREEHSVQLVSNDDARLRRPGPRLPTTRRTKDGVKSV